MYPTIYIYIYICIELTSVVPIYVISEENTHGQTAVEALTP